MLACWKWYHVLLISTFILLLAGCSGAGKTKEKKEREPFIIEPEPEKPRGMRLAPLDSSVKSIQLYRSTPSSVDEFTANSVVERQFPILVLNSGEVLDLEFDLLDASGRPLSIYFYHMDIDWQRDLSPAQYLGTFQRDDIINYTPSRATDVPYTHYSYRFPNQSMSFLVSGNYILRVTEQGRETEVLFERPFFITEQITAVQMGIENIIVGQGGFAAIQPAALFLQPASLDGNVFDFKVCFTRNGRFESPRCSEQPSLSQPPSLRFFLQPSQAFEPITADFFLDLSALRVGNQIARVDFNEIPFRITLEPDYARFPGNSLDPVLNGQTVISGVVQDVSTPDFSAQYVNVLFSYIPETGQRLGNSVYITGSFNGWQADAAHQMQWIPEREQYEVELLLKQGHYDYRYVVSQDRLPRGTVPRPENLYTAFVYYSDIRLNTDRLLGMSSFLGQ